MKNSMISLVHDLSSISESQHSIIPPSLSSLALIISSLGLIAVTVKMRQEKSSNVERLIVTMIFQREMRELKIDSGHDVQGQHYIGRRKNQRVTIWCRQVQDMQDSHAWWDRVPFWTELSFCNLIFVLRYFYFNINQLKKYYFPEI